MMETLSIGVLGLLGVVFVTLKLCHVIAWSWWWVTLPFWVGFAFVGGYILFGMLLVIGVSFFHKRRHRR